MARVQALPSASIELVELLSVAPMGLDAALAAAVVEAPELAADPAMAAGLVERQGTLLRFRHELARQAVESACGPGR